MEVGDSTAGSAALSALNTPGNLSTITTITTLITTPPSLQVANTLLPTRIVAKPSSLTSTVAKLFATSSPVGDQSESDIDMSDGESRKGEKRPLSGFDSTTDEEDLKTRLEKQQRQESPKPTSPLPKSPTQKSPSPKSPTTKSSTTESPSIMAPIIDFAGDGDDENEQGIQHTAPIADKRRQPQIRRQLNRPLSRRQDPVAFIPPVVNTPRVVKLLIDTLTMLLVSLTMEVNSENTNKVKATSMLEHAARMLEEVGTLVGGEEPSRLAKEPARQSKKKATKNKRNKQVAKQTPMEVANQESPVAESLIDLTSNSSPMETPSTMSPTPIVANDPPTTIVANKPLSWASRASRNATKKQVATKPVKQLATKHLLVVKPTDLTTKSSATRQAVLDDLRKANATNLLKGVKTASNGSVIIEVSEVGNVAKMIEAFKKGDKLPQSFTIEESRKKLPTVAIRGAEVANVESENVVKEIVANNPELADSLGDISVVFIKKARSGKDHLRDVTLRVSPTVRDIILKLGHIKFSVGKARVEDNTLVTQCFKCLGFGHQASRCTGTTRCSFCAGDHSYKECNVREVANSSPTCHNCRLHGEKLVAKHPSATIKATHSATSNRCPRLISMKSLIQQRTDYGAR
jgi:hypothetical protein